MNAKNVKKRVSSTNSRSLVFWFTSTSIKPPKLSKLFSFSKGKIGGIKYN